MRPSIFAMLTVAGALAAGPALAAGSGVQQPRTARKQQEFSPDRPNQYDQVCKPVAFTGTRLSRYKVCKSRAEWDLQWRSQRESLQKDMQRLINPLGSVR